MQKSNYFDIKELTYQELDTYLQKGYEIVELKKVLSEYGGETLIYCVGYSYATSQSELKKIIKLYEQYGFKEELLKKVAEQIGENVEDYDTFPDGRKVNNELVNLLEKYQFVVNGKSNISYYKKLSQEELQEKFGE